MLWISLCEHKMVHLAGDLLGFFLQSLRRKKDRKTASFPGEPLTTQKQQGQPSFDLSPVVLEDDHSWSWKRGRKRKGFPTSLSQTMSRMQCISCDCLSSLDGKKTTGWRSFDRRVMYLIMLFSISNNSVIWFCAHTAFHAQPKPLMDERRLFCNFKVSFFRRSVVFFVEIKNCSNRVCVATDCSSTSNMLSVSFYFMVDFSKRRQWKCHFSGSTPNDWAHLRQTIENEN